SSVIAGTFPNFKTVMPNSFEARVQVNPYELIKALERVSVLNGSDTVVALNVQDGLIEITAKSERGNAREELEAVTKNTMKIHFNANYLISAIKNTATGDGDVQIGFSGLLKPAMLKPAGGGNIYT